MKCKRVKKEIILGRLRIVFDFVSKDCFMGRFGGGWNWKVGFQAGGKTIILNLLIFALRIEIMSKVKEGEKGYKKLIEAIKWHIIIYIDAKYPESCWANLVAWQIGAASFRETFGKEDSRWNSQDCSEEYGGAYCGKCVQIGRLKE